MHHLRLSALILAALLSIASAREESEKTTVYGPTIRVEPLMQTRVTTSGAPIEYPETNHPEVRTILVEIPPGAQTGWHKHPMPCYAYMLSGTIAVEMENGKTITYKAGQAFAEMVNTMHNGKNLGKVPVKILMVVTGERGVPVSVRGEAPEKQEK